MNLFGTETIIIFVEKPREEEHEAVSCLKMIRRYPSPAPTCLDQVILDYDWLIDTDL